MVAGLLAALLATASPRPAAGVGVVALDGVERVHRALLPRLTGPVSLRVHALDALIVVEAPRAVGALARALRLSPLAVCPDMEETATGVALHCRSRRIVARLARSATGYAIDLSETRGLPWDGEDGAPVVAFDPVEAGLGGRCPGSTPAGRAECLLARGDRAAARALLAEVTGSDADGLPALRLGDLAFAEADVLGATSHWSRTRGEPWEKLAAARLCELSWICLATSQLDALYASTALPVTVARDLQLRHARSLAFLGRPALGAALLSSAPAASGCTVVPDLCRDIAGAALADPGPGALDALALWLTVPEHERGATAYRSTIAAAAVADREGAPIFAANLLATAAGQVPKRSLRDHLLRTAELYLSGGDKVRAGVVLDFARARAGERGLPGPRWAAVARAVRERGAPPAARDARRAPAPSLAQGGAP